MNSGGEPERDDTGLPPVDIEIPDDARELDRDVQAYYREQRAERRRLRRRRLRRTLTRDGMLLPLLACSLILALITGTLLTVFSAASDQNLTRLPPHGTVTSRPRTSGPTTSGPTSGTPTSGPGSSVAPSRDPSTSSAPAGSRAGSGGSAPALNPHVVQTRQPLPAGTLTLTGSGQRVPLQNLDATLLVLVPPACGCGTAVSWLAGIGAGQRVAVYLVGTPQTIVETSQLRSRLPASLQTEVPVALDQESLLAHKYRVKGLTAVMVARHPRAGQSAAYAQHLSAKDSPAPLIHALDG